MIKQIERVYQWVRRVCDTQGYSIRRPTHIAQNAEGNVQLAFDWVIHVRQQIAQYEISHDCIVNMDETSVKFDLVPSTTIAKRGKKEIRINKPKVRQGGRLTAALTGFFLFIINFRHIF